MRKLALILVLFAMATTACDLDVSDPLQSLAIKNAARALGYAIATASPEADVIIRAGYVLFTKGELTEVAMTSLIGQLAGVNPLLQFAALDLLEAMGAVLNREQGSVLNLDSIPAEVWPVVERSYLQGYTIGQQDRARGIVRAVP